MIESVVPLVAQRLNNKRRFRCYCIVMCNSVYIYIPSCYCT